MRFQCPCCGSDLPSRAPLESAIRRMGPVSAALVRALAGRVGAWVRTDDLFEMIWSDDADGGPINTRACISQAKRRANVELARAGWRIEARQWSGYRLTQGAAHGLRVAA